MSTGLYSSAPRGAAPSAYYRATLRAPPADDYEPWYTEPLPNNRMVMALRSGIPDEVEWSLHRLTRLSNDERFAMQPFPGMTDALLEWPEWYIDHGLNELSGIKARMFCISAEDTQKLHWGLNALLVLKNGAMNDVNLTFLAAHPRVPAFILSAPAKLLKAEGEQGCNVEFLVNILEILRVIAPYLQIPVPPSLITLIQDLSIQSKNRTIIISSLRILAVFLTKNTSLSHFSPTSPSLDASIRYLPLFKDTDLVVASVEYIYSHVSNSSMAKTFLLHPRMPPTVKALLSLIVAQQESIVEEVVMDIGGPIQKAPVQAVTTKDYQLDQVELDALVPIEEPERCYKWMRTMFAVSPTAEQTQVEFWNLYKETFTRFTPQYPSLIAAEVIKNVTIVFPNAQAMVLAGPPQRFVIRGIDRRKVETPSTVYNCQWDRSSCTTSSCNSASELHKHLLESHFAPSTDLMQCTWSSCSFKAPGSGLLKAHVLTHVPPAKPPAKHASQPAAVTLSFNSPYPTPTPTSRPPPPPPQTLLAYQWPKAEPPSASLTALLILRILFKLSFVVGDVVLRADDDHFGFPGIEQTADDEEEDVDKQRDDEGQRNGRLAFKAAGGLLERLVVADEAISLWIDEMLAAVNEDE